MPTSRALHGFGLLLIGAALACAKPEPPRITPESASVTSIGTTGLGISARLDVHNPNDVDLNVRSVKAKLVLDRQVDAGAVTVPHAVALPSKKSVKLDVPLTIPWQSVQSLATLAAAQKDVPYSVDGTVELGAGSFSVNVPFRLDGVITRAQLLQSAIGSLPKIPGLPVP